ncbi:MAG: glycyl-radical enzyme activating protein [Deltaproteobacteria bacterium]|nr:glycyl-radical enzyme activating protein [Deltaproteobacteria bacterium]
MTGLITNIQRFCIHDGPGIRTTVFFKGCPLSCVWCQNPETIKSLNEVLFAERDCISCKICIEACPHDCFKWMDKIIYNSDKCDQCGICVDECPSGALKWAAKEFTVEGVLNEIMRDSEYYIVSSGGCTLSGGEPLFQYEFSYELTKNLKSAGIHVTIDTAGSVSPDLFRKITGFADLFLFDLKFIDGELHRRWTGVSNELILENFQTLCEFGKDVVVRVPLIKGITDGYKNISDIKKYTLSKKVKVEFIPFNKLAAKKYHMLGRDCPVAYKGD